MLFAAGSWCDESAPKAKAVYESVAERYGPLAKLDAATLDKVNDDPHVRAVAHDTFVPLFAMMLAYCISLQLILTLSTVRTRVRAFTSLLQMDVPDAIGRKKPRRLCAT